jgi:type II secretory ATPase GspE/PulE/Tfp pilus assembly ATPase PilB-like protein
MRLVGITQEEADHGNICKPVGCLSCGSIGYRGRKAIFEMFRMNSEIRELAFKRAPIGQVRAAAIRSGMRTLLGDGKIKILRGDTTMDEISKYAQAETLVGANVDI